MIPNINFNCLFAFIAFFSFSTLSAQTVYTVPAVPDPKSGAGTGYVSDPDDFITPAEESNLHDLLVALEDSTGVQVAVVLVNSIGEDNPKEFAVRLFEHWGIGAGGADKGLLIFTVMDQRRTEFETGYGLEGILPDATCYRIGMQELVPYFRQEQYGQGLIAAITEIKETLEDPSNTADINTLVPAAPPPTGWRAIPVVLRIYLILVGVFLTGLALWVFQVLYSKDSLYDKYMDLRKSYSFIWIIFFPLPYAILYFLIKAKLKRLRNQTRYSEVNGKIMHKLSEEEEDEWLDQGQITEEEIGAVDYDVWITEDRDELLVLRYDKRFSKYGKCPQCGYKTYYHARTETIKKATYSHSGLQEKIYECKNCNYRKKKKIVLPKLQKSGSGAASFSGGGSSWGGGSGSSSWGGGSSGGGGAGVSW